MVFAAITSKTAGLTVPYTGCTLCAFTRLPAQLVDDKGTRHIKESQNTGREISQYKIKHHQDSEQ